jgi:hypothetical protein
MHQISQAAINHIIAEEVSSPAYYERHYRKPEWPGGASGVTVGNGYDLGYASPQKIRDDCPRATCHCRQRQLLL